MANITHSIINFFYIILLLVFVVACSKSPMEGFQNRSTSSSSSSDSTQDAGPWSLGIPGPISSSENYGAEIPSTSTYCALYIPVETFNREQEFRIVVLSKDVVRVEVSVNNSGFASLGTHYGELRWPGNTFDPGTYNLVFRGVSTAGNLISCDPSAKQVVVKNTSGVQLPPITPPVTPTPPPPSSSEPIKYSQYISVIGNNNKATQFRTTQMPQSVTSITVDGVALKVLDYEASGQQGKLKFFLPPGTVAFDANFYLFLAQQEGKGALKLYSPPTIDINTITPSIVNVPDNIPNGNDYSKIFGK